MDGRQPKKRGRKADNCNPLLLNVERLGREIEQLTERLKQTELIIGALKKPYRCGKIPWKPARETEALDGYR
jgi:hypothetical protein